MSNPYQSAPLIATPAAVGDSLVAALVSSKVNITRAVGAEVFIKIATVGNVTDLRVRAYVSDRLDPAAFTAGGNVDWAPVPVATYTGGSAAMDPFEAEFAAATWFPSDDKCVVVPFRARGVWLIVVLYDGAADGSGSAVTANTYMRVEA